MFSYKAIENELSKPVVLPYTAATSFYGQIIGRMDSSRLGVMSCNAKLSENFHKKIQELKACLFFTERQLENLNLIEQDVRKAEARKDFTDNLIRFIDTVLAPICFLDPQTIERSAQVIMDYLSESYQDEERFKKKKILQFFETHLPPKPAKFLKSIKKSKTKKRKIFMTEVQHDDLKKNYDQIVFDFVKCEEAYQRARENKLDKSERTLAKYMNQFKSVTEIANLLIEGGLRNEFELSDSFAADFIKQFHDALFEAGMEKLGQILYWEKFERDVSNYVMLLQLLTGQSFTEIWAMHSAAINIVDFDALQPQEAVLAAIRALFNYLLSFSHFEQNYISWVEKAALWKKMRPPEKEAKYLTLGDEYEIIINYLECNSPDFQDERLVRIKSCQDTVAELCKLYAFKSTDLAQEIYINKVLLSQFVDENFVEEVKNVYRIPPLPPENFSAKLHRLVSLKVEGLLLKALPALKLVDNNIYYDVIVESKQGSLASPTAEDIQSNTQSEVAYYRT